MSKPGLAPRRAAVQMLDSVLGDGMLISELANHPKGPLAGLEPQDRARAQRLAMATLRGMDRADRMLGKYLHKVPGISVHNTLRLATVEMCGEGAPPHGVVDAAVEMTRLGKHTSAMSGLVNAVCRKIASDGPKVWAGLPPSQMPKWLRKPLIGDYGKEVIIAIEAAHAAGAPLDLTPKNGDAKALAAQVSGTVLPTGSVRVEATVQVTGLPGFEAGDWWVQDAAAALPARILAPQKGERVLDLCCAPGGKTMQLAAAGADVTAVDISEARMARVRENLTRTGLSAKTIVADALKWEPEAPFDAILLDAPCSATGTIRRHADLPYAKDGGDFPGLFDLQAQMIDRAVQMLKPGGRLVYCTCSLLPDEGEIQVTDALARHRSLRVDSKALMVEGVDPAWLSAEGGLRLRPDYWAERGGMDGFFIAVFRKAT